MGLPCALFPLPRRSGRGSFRLTHSPAAADPIHRRTSVPRLRLSRPARDSLTLRLAGLLTRPTVGLCTGLQGSPARAATEVHRELPGRDSHPLVHRAFRGALYIVQLSRSTASDDQTQTGTVERMPLAPSSPLGCVVGARAPPSRARWPACRLSLHAPHQSLPQRMARGRRPTALRYASIRSGAVPSISFQYGLLRSTPASSRIASRAG